MLKDIEMLKAKVEILERQSEMQAEMNELLLNQIGVLTGIIYGDEATQCTEQLDRLVNALLFKHVPPQDNPMCGADFDNDTVGEALSKLIDNIDSKNDEIVEMADGYITTIGQIRANHVHPHPIHKIVDHNAINAVFKEEDLFDRGRVTFYNHPQVKIGTISLEELESAPEGVKAIIKCPELGKAILQNKYLTPSEIEKILFGGKNND